MPRMTYFQIPSKNVIPEFLLREFEFDKRKITKKIYNKSEIKTHYINWRWHIFNLKKFISINRQRNIYFSYFYEINIHTLVV